MCTLNCHKLIADKDAAFTLDDLDSLMNDIESQSTRRRLPGTYEMPKMAARKTTTRKSATVCTLVLDTEKLGHDLLESLGCFGRRGFGLGVGQHHEHGP